MNTTHTKHTPGPWTAKEGSRVYLSTIYGVGDDAVAEVHCDSFGKERHADGNARLIAAAPQLLEAIDAIRSLAQYEGGAFNPDIVKICNTAIAKATGGAS